MRIKPEPSIRINVDPSNPGQFFACCGLLELADRIWPGAEGWFENCDFCISCQGDTVELFKIIDNLELTQLDPSDATSSPIELPAPISLILNWWNDELYGGKNLKVWSGKMNVFRIARAMQKAMSSISNKYEIFNYSTVVYDPDQKSNKVEPFYFDSRRGQNSHALDIGFSPDKFKMPSAANPAVEFLCLIGIQRCRPTPAKKGRFYYYLWVEPLNSLVLAAFISGAVKMYGSKRYCFQNAFRSDQKKHKAFLPATLRGV